jgi:hypothetical protein
MTADSDWEALRARIERLRETVAAEIRDYPAPIPACDAQYNHLLERRTALAAALATLDAACADGAGTPEDFLASTQAIRQGGR